MRKLLAIMLVVVPVLSVVAGDPARPAGESPATTEETIASPWLDDFHFMLGEIASHYANLDSVIHDRRIDLAALKKRAEDRIRAATNDREAQIAIDQFIAAFGDGHAYVRWPSPSTSASPDEKKKTLCDRLDYAPRDFGGINFARLDAYTATSDDDAIDIPGGILRLTNDRPVGILRIHLFSENVHPQLCLAAQHDLGLADDAACDADCRHELNRRVADRLTLALERRIASLTKAGAVAIVVDLTGNGGGSDWVDPAARVLAPIPLLAPRLGFIRHAHWVTDLNDRLADVKADLAKNPDDSFLQAAAAKLRDAAKKASEVCDRRSLFADEPSTPDCSLVVSDLLYSTGILNYAKPRSLDKYESKGVLFHPSLYAYDENTNRLPLFVLVDGRTASASEYFAAMMQDNHAATIVGLPTLGAGCGQTNGGIDATLTHSGGRLVLPDCIRLRANGDNEVLGITPDVLIPWSNADSPYQRATRVEAALEKSVKPRNTLVAGRVVDPNAHSHDRHSGRPNP